MGISTSSLGKVRYNVRGVYNTSDSYTVDDIVNYGGGQYLSKQNKNFHRFVSFEISKLLSDN